MLVTIALSSAYSPLGARVAVTLCKHFAIYYFLLCKKKPVNFDGELKIGDVRYDNIT